MKIPFGSFDNIQKMNRKELTVYLSELCAESYKQGLKDGENEMDNASFDQWFDFISETPGTKELFTIADCDELEKCFTEEINDSIHRLLNDIGDRFNVSEMDKINNLLYKHFTPDILWKALEKSSKNNG